MLYVCAWAPVCVYVCIYVCSLSTYVCGVQRSMLFVFLNCLHFIFLRQGFSSGLEFTNKARLAGRWSSSRNLPVPVPSLLGLQRYCHAQLLCGYLLVWQPFYQLSYFSSLRNWNHTKQFDSVRIMPYGYPNFSILAGVCLLHSPAQHLNSGLSHVQLKELLAETVDINTSAEFQSLFQHPFSYIQT